MTKSLVYLGDTCCKSSSFFLGLQSYRTRNFEIHRLIMFLVFIRWQNLIPRPKLD